MMMMMIRWDRKMKLRRKEVAAISSSCLLVERTHKKQRERGVYLPNQTNISLSFCGFVKQKKNIKVTFVIISLVLFERVDSARRNRKDKTKPSGGPVSFVLWTKSERMVRFLILFLYYDYYCCYCCSIMSNYYYLLRNKNHSDKKDNAPV